MTALLDALAKTRREQDRGVVLSAKVWRDLRTERGRLHAFVQRVAEESTQPELVAAARKLGAEL